jgi:hypothetical protein
MNPLIRSNFYIIGSIDHQNGHNYGNTVGKSRMGVMFENSLGVLPQPVIEPHL